MSGVPKIPALQWFRCDLGHVRWSRNGEFSIQKPISVHQEIIRQEILQYEVL